jgi:polyribonucleotide nucleotidyltransferase
MGLQTPIEVSFQLPNGQEVIIETGKLATQAHGSVVLKVGKMMLFASVVSNKEPKQDAAFFPLFVDYQEKFAAAGRIPGNFFKREARLSDYEVLICRLIDRAIRPLFPDDYMNETQVIVNLISADPEIRPDAYAALAASSAIWVSDIPWNGPISEVRVAKINDQYVINPLISEMADASLDFIVAATEENVMMVEGEASECQENELIDAIKVAHDAIKVQCQAQQALAEKVGEKALVKRELEVAEENEEVAKIVKDFAGDRIMEVARGKFDKKARKDQLSAIMEDLMAELEETKDEEWLEANGSFVGHYFDKLKKELIREMVMSDKVRLDGRKPDEVRAIWSEVNYLPSAHGSAIFTRGETQSLTSVTLGTKLDQIMVDTAMNTDYDKFILHYNFPALSVGEVKPMRGPGRREVGHANLAGRSIRRVLQADIPYTIRIVSDILESNGSSSMATVCAGSLALMDAGIPIAKTISGIAMGLISDGARAVVLSDILGDEDALGDMDFKVTGTEDGICACQMDIKIEGLSYDLLEKALHQAKEGRIHILNEMNKTISSPREDLKPHAPRMIEFSIDKEFIGAVIGPGGKVIQDMQEKTQTTINIEEKDGKGIVSIFSPDANGINEARRIIDKITYKPQVGDVYDAVVASVMPYGVFVDFMGSSGLLHVSEISHSRIQNVSDVFKEGDPVKVKLIGIDPKSGKLRLSRKALLPKPDHNSNRQPQEKAE